MLRRTTRAKEPHVMLQSCSAGAVSYKYLRPNAGFRSPGWEDYVVRDGPFTQTLENQFGETAESHRWLLWVQPVKDQQVDHVRFFKNITRSLCLFTGVFSSGLSSLRKYTSPTSQHGTFTETTWTVCAGWAILFFLRWWFVFLPHFSFA